MLEDTLYFTSSSEVGLKMLLSHFKIQINTSLELSKYREVELKMLLSHFKIRINTSLELSKYKVNYTPSYSNGMYYFLFWYIHIKYLIFLFGNFFPFLYVLMELNYSPQLPLNYYYYHISN